MASFRHAWLILIDDIVLALIFSLCSRDSCYILLLLLFASSMSYRVYGHTWSRCLDAPVHNVHVHRRLPLLIPQLCFLPAFSYMQFSHIW